MKKIHSLNRREFIQYSSIFMSTSLIAACAKDNQDANLLKTSRDIAFQLF